MSRDMGVHSQRHRPWPLPYRALLVMSSALVAVTALLAGASGAVDTPGSPIGQDSSQPAQVTSWPAPAQIAGRPATASASARDQPGLLSFSGRAAVATRPVSAVVGLGDSVATGTGCGCRNFISGLGAALAASQRTPVDTRNLARNGLTTAGLLDLLRDPNVAAAVRLSDVAVVTIGANDFDDGPIGSPDCAPATRSRCYRGSLSDLRTTLTATVSRLQRLRGARPSRIVLTGYWNVFLDGAVGRAQGRAYVANSDALTRAVNAVIKDVAMRHGARYADLYAAFKSDGDADDTALLAADGDHPSAAGHRLITATVRRALAG